MFVALWEFEVKPGSEEKFEDIYGTQGTWVRLFRKSTEYRETRLLKDAIRERVYMTLDFWESRDAYDIFKKLHKTEYDSIDRACEGLTLCETKIGEFESEETA